MSASWHAGLSLRHRLTRCGHSAEKGLWQIKRRHYTIKTFFGETVGAVLGANNPVIKPERFTGFIKTGKMNQMEKRPEEETQGGEEVMQDVLLLVGS